MPLKSPTASALVLIIMFLALPALGAQAGSPAFFADLEKGGIVKMPFLTMLDHSRNDEAWIGEWAAMVLARHGVELEDTLPLELLSAQTHKDLDALAGLYPLYNSRPKPLGSFASPPAGAAPEALRVLAERLERNAAMYAAILKHPLMGRVEHRRFNSLCSALRLESTRLAAAVRAMKPRPVLLPEVVTDPGPVDDGLPGDDDS